MVPQRDRSSPSRMQCHSCGSTVSQDAAFCPQCGTERPAARRASFCGDCGAKFAAEDAFCSNCGASRGLRSEPNGTLEESRAPTALRGFRRHVQEHLEEGWEIEQDYGNRVVLIDRDIGSIPIHVMLLIFTGGLGNLLYGWYQYVHTAERRYLSVDDMESVDDVGPVEERQSRSDGTVRSSSSDRASGTDDGQSIVHYGTSLAVLLFGLAFLTGGGSVGAGIGLVLVTVAMSLLPPVRDRIDRRHELTAFGRRRTVDQRVIAADEPHDEDCVVCGREFDGGLLRRRRDETVIAGLPVRTHRMQYNHYCPDCARAEIFDRSSSHDSSLEAELRAAKESDRQSSEERPANVSVASNDEPR